MIRNLVLLSAVLFSASTFHIPIHPPVDTLTVESLLGKYRGFNYTTTSGAPAEIFLGIRYAQPPLGELRFEKPVRIGPHRGVFNATKFSDTCIPHTQLAVTPGFTASEDCLTLNIIRPKPKKPTSFFRAFLGEQEKLPVLVWVHGGGYEIGSASQYGYTGFADNYVPEGIIVVSIQYRLGIHGYLATGSKWLPGNYGSFDQVRAFQWLHENIASFGGDPNKITAWGLSAGGCSAAELVLNREANSYIAGAIEMSGSAFSYWGTGTTVYNNSKAYISALGCPPDGLALKKCLKRKTVAELYEGVNIVGYTTQGLDSIKWGPVIDGDFLAASPFELAKTIPKKPVFVGTGDKDTGYFGVLGYSPYIQNLSIPISVQSNFTRDALVSLINRLIKPDWFGSNRDLAIQKMIDRYAPIGQSVGETLNQYLRWTDDLYFFRPTADGVIARRDAGWEVYAYEFKQYNPIIFLIRGMNITQAWGSVHTNEYAYMFELFNMGPYAWTGDDAIVHQQIVAAISSFTKNQKPSIPGKYWPSVGNDLNFYVFEGEGRVEQNYYQDAYNFMGELNDLGFDLSFLSPTADVQR